jgi:hypothetical protein
MEQSILAIKAEQKRTEDARTTCVLESANTQSALRICFTLIAAVRSPET